MTPKEILLLGNPLLTKASVPVLESELDDAIAVGKDLEATMFDFREKHGWGRAISAPQINIRKRIIYLNVDGPWLIINPEMTDESGEMMEIWDDCMSFPELLVKVSRHVSFTMTWRDDEWRSHTRKIEGLFSELLQHEIDHLNGILAISRAVDADSFALQSQRAMIPGAIFANQLLS